MYVYLTECLADYQYPCSESASNAPVCVNELQYCNGVADCPGGSDELSNCYSGISNNNEIIIVHESDYLRYMWLGLCWICISKLYVGMEVIS